MAHTKFCEIKRAMPCLCSHVSFVVYMCHKHAMLCHNFLLQIASYVPLIGLL